MFTEDLVARVRQFCANFPFPVAVTAHKLAEQMRREDSLAALLAVRDAIESALKLSACLAIAYLRKTLVALPTGLQSLRCSSMTPESCLASWGGFGVRTPDMPVNYQNSQKMSGRLPHVPVKRLQTYRSHIGRQAKVPRGGCPNKSNYQVPRFTLNALRVRRSALFFPEDINV